MNASTIVPSNISLVVFKDARHQIAEATTVDQVNSIVALATGLAAAARKATDKELEAEAAVLKFEAERKLGQLMECQKAMVGFNVGTKGSKIKGARVSEKPTLEEAGINKNLAHRARQARAVPEAQVKHKKDEIRSGVMVPKQAKPKAPVNARDIALEKFDAHVLELIRLMKGQKPRRFAKTGVALLLLGDLAHYLRELVAVRKPAAETAADDAVASADAGGVL
jgi:hypothetical protein